MRSWVNRGASIHVSDPMPYARITTNQTPPDANALLAEASGIIARETGKPEAYRWGFNGGTFG